VLCLLRRRVWGYIYSGVCVGRNKKVKVEKYVLTWGSNSGIFATNIGIITLNSGIKRWKEMYMY